MSHKAFPIIVSLFVGLALAIAFGVSVAGSVSAIAAAPGASIRHVAPGGNCGGATPCYDTIQAAVEAATAGDEIRVATGTYTGVHARPDITGAHMVTQTVYISKTVTIRGGYRTTNWSDADPLANPTLLDARGQGRVFTVEDNPATGLNERSALVGVAPISPTIEGLRITGGHSATDGGGVYLRGAAAVLRSNEIYSNSAGNGAGAYLFDSPAVLAGNRIHHNTASGGGGGLNIWNSGATVSGNHIYSNTADYGGGAALIVSPSSLSGNVIWSNTAANGSGLDLMYGSNATLVNNVMGDNATGPTGAHLSICNSLPRLLHNTIAASEEPRSLGVYLCSGTNRGVEFTNTIVSGFSVGVLVEEGGAARIQGVLWHNNGADTGGDGSIRVAHAHAGSPAFVNPLVGDYHIGAASAAIDHGLNAGVAHDIDGDRRPQCALPDLGADEFVRHCCYLPVLLRW